MFQKNLTSSNPNYKIAVAVYPDSLENKLEIYNAKDKLITFSVLEKLGLSKDIFKSVKFSKKEVLEKYVKGTFSVDKEGFISVEGSVDFSNLKGYSSILEFAKFKSVSGNFILFGSSFKSLEGCPSFVGGNFSCGLMKIKTLKFCPEYVGGYFDCAHTDLNTLQYSPREVGGDFSCGDTFIKTLRFLPKLNKGFSCVSAPLRSLRGLPKILNGNLVLRENDLNSLKYCPKVINGNLEINSNQLEDLQHCPKIVTGNFSLTNNYGRKFSKEEILATCEVGHWVIV